MDEEGKEKEGGIRRRDASPSAASQSSALEWDPSADVGSSSVLAHHEDEDDEEEMGREQQHHRPENDEVENPHENYDLVSGAQAPNMLDLITSEEAGLTRRAGEKGVGTPRISRSKSYEWGPYTTVPPGGGWFYKKGKDYEERKEGGHGQRGRGSPKSSSSSTLFVEIHQRLKGEQDVRNMGVQTSVADDSEQETSSLASSIYHSTPTEKRVESQRVKGQGNAKNRGVGKENVGDREEGEGAAVFSKSRRTRDRSPPQPFAVASRKSSHRHHHASHSRREFSSLQETDVRDSEDDKGRKKRLHVGDSSSSEMSPPCFLLDKLANTGKSKDKKDDIITAIEIHRDYHVKKVRHELKQLEKLNQLLSKKIALRNRHPSTSSTDIEIQKKSIDKENQKKTSHPKSPVKKMDRGTRDEVSSVPVSDSSTSVGSMLEGTSSLEIKGATNSTKGVLKESNPPSGEGTNHQPGETLEKKLDELMDAFTFIAGMLLDKETEKEKREQKRREDQTRPPIPPQDTRANGEKRKVLSPIAYFIPFPTCEGQYVFRKEDIEMGKNKPVINTESRTISRQDVRGGSVVGSVASADYDEDIENRDPEVPFQQENLAKLPLQTAFERRCPNFVNRLRQRETILSQIRSERELRAEKKREWIRIYGKGPKSIGELEKILPPKGPRLMSSKEMKEITRRNYKKLPEVEEKRVQRKMEEEKKTNRIMSQVFAQQLRRGVLKGETNFQPNLSLIRK